MIYIYCMWSNIWNMLNEKCFMILLFGQDEESDQNCSIRNQNTLSHQKSNEINQTNQNHPGFRTKFF